MKKTPWQNNLPLAFLPAKKPPTGIENVSSPQGSNREIKNASQPLRFMPSAGLDVQNMMTGMRNKTPVEMQMRNSPINQPNGTPPQA